MKPMHDLLAPYLLGTLEDEQHEEFVEHLLACEQCQAERVELEPGLATLAYSNAVHPPDGLRHLVLSAVSGRDEVSADAEKESTLSERDPIRRWGAFLLPVAAAIVLLVGAFAIFGSNPIDRVTGAPDATTIALATSDAYQGSEPGTANVVFSAGQESAVIEITGLAPPTGSNVYEMWLIGSDGALPAGTFIPGTDGTVLVKLEGMAKPGLVVGITEEPAGGSESPTGNVLFSAEL